MAISELKPRQGKVEITADVMEKGDIRQFEKFGKSGRVCNAKISDETGQVTLTLWNDEIDKVNVGDKIKVSNGWVSEWQGELQLSAGKFGKLEIVGKAEAQDSKPEPIRKNFDENTLKAGSGNPSEEELDEEPTFDEEEIE